MSDQDIATWWDSDDLTEDDRIEWCAAAIDGLVAGPLAATVPAEHRADWLTPVDPDLAAVIVDEDPPLPVSEMSDDLVAFIDANC